MKNLFLPFIALLFAFQAGAQVTAITEEGRAVILFSNGTWRYLNDSVKVSTLDLPHYTIPGNSTAVVKREKKPVMNYGTMQKSGIFCRILSITTANMRSKS